MLIKKNGEELGGYQHKLELLLKADTHINKNLEQNQSY